MLSAIAEHERQCNVDALNIQEVQREQGSVIRPATDTDFESIMQIENACFPGDLAYTREQMASILFKPDTATFVEVSGGTLSGYVTATFERNSETAGIETIGVFPHSRGRGVGKRLLSAAEDCMAKRGVKKSALEVSVGNAIAISMYSKAGYGISHEIPNYYLYDHHGTKKAYRMEKPLQP